MTVYVVWDLCFFLILDSVGSLINTIKFKYMYTFGVVVNCVTEVSSSIPLPPLYFDVNNNNIEAKMKLRIYLEWLGMAQNG